MRFFSKKAIENCIFVLFKAFFGRKTRFWSVRILLSALFVFVGVYVGYAQRVPTQQYVIETVNIFPDYITSNGWKNVDQIRIQNLSDDALSQEFNRMNSAYIDRDAYKEALQNTEAAANLTTETSTPVEEIVASTTIDTQTQILAAPTSTTEASPVSTSSRAGSSVDVISVPKSIPGVSDTNATIDEVSATSVSVKTDAPGIFNLVFNAVKQVFPFAQEVLTSSTTPETVPDAIQVDSTVPSTTDSQTFVAEDSQDTIVSSSTSPSEASVNRTITDEIFPAATSTTATTTQIESQSATGTTPSAEVDTFQNSTNTALYSSTSNDLLPSVSEPLPETEPEECDGVDTCLVRSITLSGFGLPIFDQTLRFGGGQLRMSFAAKRKVNREEVQQLSIAYSLDDGQTWQESGAVIIDEEASNSINGGFYLFAIPELQNAQQLDTLQIKLIYKDNFFALENIFIDSVWLEVFTVRAPRIDEMDIQEMIGDDGFDNSLLSGDILVTDEEKIVFENTDENTGETLIIKSDKNVYDGLTKATAYFSVTNTGKKKDTFSLKTYFPKQVGTVVSLQKWNQNKPKRVVVPEYRPFSYSCTSAWQPVNKPLSDTTKSPADFTLPGVTTPAVTSDISSSVIRATSATSGDSMGEDVPPIPPSMDADNALSSTTEGGLLQSSSTVLNMVTQPLAFAQFSSVTENASLSLIPNKDTLQYASGEEDAYENNYICPSTQVVQKCDFLDGDNTACVQNDVQVRTYEVTKYAGGWEERPVVLDDVEEKVGLLKKVKNFLGLGPRKKTVPNMFEVRARSEERYTIQPGETQYFKMELEFPALSTGEFWIEAIGDREYGLLDPFWSSQWKYRMPLTIDNTAGKEDMTEQQILVSFGSAGMADFWANVNSDGSDIRFVAEVTGNIASSTWYDTSWDRRLPITIQGSQITATLTDFPVYVDLSTLGNEFFSYVQSTGADIRITAGDGVTEVPYELVSIDTTAQTGELYFKAPSLPVGTNSVFYIYFDNEGALGYAPSDTFGSQNVWTNGFGGVWHMNDASVTTITDSTANGFTGTKGASTQPTEIVDGRIGKAQNFDGNDYIDLGDVLDPGANSMTVETWHRPTVVGTANTGILYNKENLYEAAAGGGVHRYAWQPYWVWSGGNSYTTSVNNWYYSAVTYDKVTQRMYKNGSEVYNRAQTGNIGSNSSRLLFGARGDTNPNSFFTGDIDEIRISMVARSADWIGANYANQNTPTTFYATSSVEVIQPTQYTELDFWLQYFDSVAQEADIWIQVDSIPAATTTTIYMYYGNSGATSASDEFATFTYSTTTPIFYVGDTVSTGAIEVYSLIDNNIVQLDNGTPVSLNKGEKTSFTGYSGSSTISILGPVSLTINDTAADTILPISFASTSFGVPTNRNTSQYFIVSPVASSFVNTYVGSSATPDETFTVATGSVQVSNTDAAGTNAVIIEATEPILVYHREVGNRDSFVSYPATREDLFGVDSNNTQVTTLTSNPDPTVYCSDESSATVSGVLRGETQGVNDCTQGSEGTGDAVRFSGALYPFSAIQQADSDGVESTVFLPQKEFATEYFLSTAAAYVAVVCSPRFGESFVEVQTNSGTTVEAATCTPSGNFPGKAYFSNGGNGDALAFTAGHKIVSTNGVPFYVIYEDDVEDNDETNIWGAVQARKLLRYPISTSFGAQEVTIDAQYNQLSYGWYQNVNAQTPTSSWPLGEGAYATEGVPITGQGAVKDEEVFRLRINLEANVSTGTASTSAFKLQYTASDSCTASTNAWYDVGTIGSTTAAFTGYNNSAVSDGSTLASTTLASSTVFATYEEENLSSRNPNTVYPGDVAEWDWVLQSKQAQVNTNYCFRMVRESGQELVTYTTYPQLYTAGPPLQPNALVFFDNERTPTSTPVLEFTAIDAAGDEINYQVQIDNNRDFSSPEVDRNSETNYLDFENLNTPSDKAPFNSGARIRFTSPITLAASTTYWWRVRGKDPNGSNTNGEWSVPRSFTIDASVVETEWFQTTGDQFSTDTLVDLATSTGGVSLVNSPAILTTTAIDFDDGTVGNAWGTISWNDTETSGSIVYQVEYLSGSSWKLVPDSEIPDNSVGTSTSPINILGLDTDTYNQIRIVATLTGTTLSIEDITVTWGQRVNTPTLGDPFDNEKTADLTPTFTFSTTDPQSDDLEYEISYSTDYSFVSSTTFNSTANPTNFSNVTNPSDTSPYASGDTISYTIPAGSELIDNTTYWWRVRAKDPNGANSWSPWSKPDSFTTDTTVTVSTWFQTTKEQFEGGILEGLIASTTNTVMVNDRAGEYGRATTTDNNWLTITTENTYNNMVVVGSARYSGNPQPERTVRVRNKTSNSFEIKVDDYTNAFAGGTTIVDYMVMEAGDWIINDGSGTRIIAGTVKDVSNVKARTYAITGSIPVTFDPPFGGNPVVLATVSSDNDPTWVFTHTDDGTDRRLEPTASGAGFSLARSFESAVHEPEDIDYIAMDIAAGQINGVNFDFLRTADAVNSTATAQPFNNTDFNIPPPVIIVNNIGEDGGDGGFAFIETATPGTATDFYPEIGEGGVGANGHTNEIISAVAFESESGILLRDNTLAVISGTIASEPIYFYDGGGPKFERLLFNGINLGDATTKIQVQYQTATGSWELIPDSAIPGNASGTAASPIDLTGVDASVYDTIRIFATLQCDGSTCPEIDDWSVEWSEGVTVSGVALQADRVTPVGSGNIAIAVNGVLQTNVNMQSISNGIWSISNVTAFKGDVITVWIDAADDANEAVSVFVYDGVGDMTNVELVEQHLTISADETATTTNALLAAYDNSVSGNEDIFFDVDAGNNLNVCAISGCDNASLYIGAGNVFIPASSTAEVITTNDFINEGTVELDGNTLKVSGDWTNTGSLSPDTSTVIFTATSTTQWLSDSSNILTFNNVTFGETSGSATWMTNSPYDINGNLTVAYGTLDRSSSTINVAGSVTTGASGFWTGSATTTFDGAGTVYWSDSNSTPQNIGKVVLDGSVLTVSMSSDVRAESAEIKAGNTLDAGGANTLYLSGNFTNNNIFAPQTGTLVIEGDGTNSVITTGASDLYNLTASTTGNGAVSFNQQSVSILGDFTIATGTVTLPSGTTTIVGSFLNTGGVFAHNNGEVRFTSSAAETVQLNGSSFLNALYSVRFTGSGSWTFVDARASTTKDFLIENGNVTLPSGQLTVGGLFSVTGSGSFAHNNGEVVLLIEDANTVVANNSRFNDIRIRAGGNAGGWYNNNWRYRKAITILAASVDATLTDFPVYVDLSDLGSAFFNNVRSDGGDIRVTQGDGLTEIPREVVFVDTTTGRGELYFKANTLSSTTNTTFYVYYGNSSATDYDPASTYGSQNVWTNNFAGVWHMQDASGNTITDSTAGGYTGIKGAGSATPIATTSPRGYAQQFDGNDYIDLGDVLNPGSSNWTISTWFKPNAVGTLNASILYNKENLYEASAGGGAHTFAWQPNWSWTGGSSYPISVGQWSYGVVTYDQLNQRMYKDGSPVYIGALTGSIGSNTSRLLFAARGDTSPASFFTGELDEVRMSSVARSDAWIAAEFINQATTTDFYNISTTESAFVRSFSDTNVIVEGNVVLESGETVAPAGTLFVGGSFDNNALFNANGGTVLFNSVAGSETIAAGSSSFATLQFDSSLGDFTIVENATATVAVNLTTAGSFTVANGVVLESLGTFRNSVGGARTTWAGSVLKLSSGTDYAVNEKTDRGDSYDTLLLTGDTDIALWNSTSTVYLTNDTSSIYSQDHNGVDGSLYIFGDYIRTSGTEYWSYATDFDGTSLSATTSRQVNVRVAGGASVTASSSVLQIVGSSTASTTIDALSGTFTLTAQTATVTASYFEVAGTDVAGFNLSASSTVTSFDNALFTIGTGVAAITVDASTIDTNPASQFFNTNFVSAGGNVNVTLSGSPSSYWWFRDGSGDRYGEAYDNADGDPGSIRWDDSSYVIDISGTVYADDGVTPLGTPVCDGVSNVVRVVVDGGTYTNSVPCSGIDGSYTFSNVTYVGDPNIVVYLDTNGGTPGSVITKTPSASITNMDIYANRVITRHEDNAPLTIADMAVYDESDDSDLRFSAATGTVDTLIVRPDAELYVFASSTFTPAGTVTLQSGGSGQVYDGTLHLGNAATFTGSGTTTYSVGGSLLLDTSATFIPASSTVQMTATTSGKSINSGSTITFNELQFVGTGGGWNINSDLIINSDMYVATGTVTGTGNVTVPNGSIYGDGSISMGGGTVIIEGTNTLGGSLPWTFNNLTLGNGSVIGTTTKASNATTTVAGVFTIGTGHFVEASGAVWNLTGAGDVFVENGTFNEATSTVQYGGTADATVLNTTYYNLRINTPSGSPTITASAIGLQVLRDLTVGGAGTTTFTLDTNDPNTEVGGDVIIAQNATLIGSDTATLTVSGSWNNNGTFTPSAGTVTFDSTDAFSIAAGTSAFANVNVIGTGAGTVTEHATSSGNWNLASTSNFTVASGTRLAVGGTFTNAAGGASTTWTGSTLHLFGSGSFTINASTTSDIYNELSVVSGTHIRMWNSEATTYTTQTNGSIYSMDHANSDGALYIFGDYIQDEKTDYWSYATDFDGSDLSGGSERQAQIFFASGASAKYTAGGLTLLGTSTATTTLQNQGLGTYSLTFSGTSTVDWKYAKVRDIDSNGVVFTGTPTVQDFSFTDLLVEQNSASAITVGGTAIDASPARNFTNNSFVAAGGVTGAVNVTATGTTVSSWRYTNNSGSLAGESYDNDPGGDPGYIVWDDSAALITISGNVYSDEGTTVSAVCDDVTPNILLRVAGLTTASTTCSAATGAYSINNVTFSANDTLTLYISGETAKAATVSIDPISSISDMDLYENRVIVRHEGTDPITIADMTVWDSSDDTDIPFTAVTGTPDTLTLPANTKLIVWTNKEFAPGGEVTVSGGGTGASYDGSLELYNGATFTAAGTENHSIGGSLILGTGATFIPAQGTTTFTTNAAARTIDINNQALYNVAFTGSGSWTVTDTTFTADGSVSISNGALTLPSATSTIAGSFTNTGGAFNANGGLLYFTATSSGNVITLGGSSAHNMRFNGSGGAWTFGDTNATSTGSVIVDSGTLTLPSDTFAIDGNFENNATIVHNNGLLKLTKTSGEVQLTLSGNDLFSLTITGGASTTMTDGSASLLGDLTVASGTLAVATNTLSIGGSLDATGGVLQTASGTILFNSADVGETINIGNNVFYNVLFGSASGGWTLQGATTTNNFTLSSASSFTLAGGQTLTVGNVFTNSVGGAATTWTGSTLKLISGTTYEINSRTAGGDVYDTVVIDENTDIRSWDTSINTLTLATSSSYYSQDHAGVSGNLYIYGDFRISTSTEYWSYDTDFDGTALGASARAVQVYIDNNATTTVDGGTLNILGQAGATTTITAINPSDSFAFAVASGTLNASYYSLSNTDINGLQISGTPTITDLSNGSFLLTTSSGSSLSVTAEALNANASKIFSSVGFSASSTITGYNVSVTNGTTSSSWRFLNSYGDLDGESFDNDGVSDCGSIRWDDSACLLVEQTHYRWRNDDGGLGVPDSEWFNTNWSKRKRVRITNQDAQTYATTSVKITVTYDADMQADFDDLRFTKNDGVTEIPYWIERYVASNNALVWLLVTDLPASDANDYYMYYGNVTATSTASSSAVFVAVDDFEDGDIAEYSGDTNLFTVDGSFAYGGANGLDTTGNEASRATDGIGRTDQTVSQGEIIRWMQYVDTASGASDEACTLFGVQSVTGNTNYGVCLELFGTDRISLAKNVESTDSYGSVVVLASSTVTYTTGWYEVEVDWQTDNTIDVSLYTEDGTLVATTSASDGTYTSGGYGFTYWGQYGGWDSIVSRYRVNTAPKVTFGAEQVSGGATWNVPLDTVSDGFFAGDIARVRFSIENTGLAITDQVFQLEFADKGNAPSCESVSSANYTPVPTYDNCGSSGLCMATSTYYTDQTLIADLFEKTSGNYVYGYAVEDPSATTTAMNISQNEYTELEYAISATVNAASDAYCLRVSNNGTPLDSYTAVAEYNLAYPPSMSSISFNGGVDIALVGGTTTRIYATTTVTDLNGYADLQYATSTFYTASSTAACSADNNDCYIETTDTNCVFTACSGNSCTLSCYADIYYYADPTDTDGGNFWYAFLEVSDTTGASDFNTSPGIDVLTLRALEVTNTIDYGALAPNTDTGSNAATTTVENIGNDAIDVQIVGSDLTDGYNSTIPVTKQIFATTTFNYSTCTVCLTLSTTSVNLEVDLSKPSTTTPPVADEIYWGIAVPFGVASAPHSGSNTFYAIGDTSW